MKKGITLKKFMEQKRKAEDEILKIIKEFSEGSGSMSLVKDIVIETDGTGEHTNPITRNIHLELDQKIVTILAFNT